jgi:hypothetical protein
MSGAGTIEVILSELGLVLVTASTHLQRGVVLETLQRMGASLPSALLSDEGFDTARTDTVSAATGLQPKIDALGDAIDAGGFIDIATGLGELGAAIGSMIASFTDIGDAIAAALPSLPGVDVAAVTALTDDFERRFFEFLIIDQADQIPAIGALLTALGLIERTWHDDDEPWQSVALHLEHIGPLITQPGAHFSDLYDWGQADYDGTKLLTVLHHVFQMLGLPTHLRMPTASEPMVLEAFALDLRPSAMGAAGGLAIDMVMPIRGAVVREIPLPMAGWHLGIEGELGLEIGATSTIEPPFNLSLVPSVGPVSGGMALSLVGAPENPFILVGLAAGPRLEIAHVHGSAGFQFSWDPSTGQASASPTAEVGLSGGKLVIDLGGADGFLSEVLGSDGFAIDFDLLVGWSTDRGVYFEGGAGFELNLRINKSLGPIFVNTVQLGVYLGDDGLSLQAGVTGGLKLGPLTAVVEGIGMRALWDFNTPGNLGSTDLSLGFKPPTGLGVSLDTGAVKLGGFVSFDTENERYVGMVQISLVDTLDLTAIALLTTRMPDGESGFSLLFVITTTFPTPIHLGYNFWLTGVGGILGLHRGIDLDRLRAGIKTGVNDRILFPENVLENIDRLITDLREVFPPVRDQFVVGVMAKLTWNTPALITLKAGLVIELPDPLRIAILGDMRVAIPTEEMAIVDIKVGFLGAIDFEIGLLSFDASIYDSHVGYGAFKFSFEGDLALRVSWGAHKAFLVSIGGFHPAYTPPTHLKLIDMTRVTISLLKDNPRLTLTTYFALTTNTVQFGAQIDFYFKVWKFSVVGWFGFDVLFQFSPFRFVAGVRAGLAVRAGSTDLFSISLSFELGGTSPWHAKGTASFKILFIKVKVRFSTTWGDRAETSLPDIDVMPLVLEEFERDANWRGERLEHMADMVTMITPQLSADEILIDAAGMLSVTQNLLPLEMPFSLFTNSQPTDASEVWVHELRIGSTAMPLVDAKDEFAPAAYQALSDADKLKAPSYEQRTSGAVAQGTQALKSDHVINHSVVYEQWITDAGPAPEHDLSINLQSTSYGMDQQLFERLVPGGAISRAPLSKARRLKTPPLVASVQVRPNEAFVVIAVDTFAPVDASGHFITAHTVRAEALSRSQAEARLAALLHQDTVEADDYEVIPAFQLAA